MPHSMKNYLPYGILFLLALIWGSSFILIKRGLEAFGPMQVAELRVAFAGLTMLPFALSYLPRVKMEDIKYYIIVFMCGNFGPAFFFAIAQTKLASGITGVLNSLVPIFTMLIGVLIFKVKPGKPQILGVLLGFGGAVMLVFARGASTELDSLGYAGLVILATLFYSISLNTIKAKLSHYPPLMTASIPVTLSGIMGALLIPFTPFNWDAAFGQDLPNLGYIFLLGFMGTAVALILFNRLVQLKSALFSSSVTYLIPVVAMIWGIVDGEQLALAHFSGMALILAGVYLINQKRA